VKVVRLLRNDNSAWYNASTRVIHPRKLGHLIPVAQLCIQIRIKSKRKSEALQSVWEEAWCC
jgi:hypothetical protein